MLRVRSFFRIKFPRRPTFPFARWHNVNDIPWLLQTLRATHLADRDIASSDLYSGIQGATLDYVARSIASSRVWSRYDEYEVLQAVALNSAMRYFQAPVRLAASIT